MKTLFKGHPLKTTLGAVLFMIAANTALAQSDQYRPLALAPAEVGEAAAGDTLEPKGILADASVLGQSADEVAKQLANPNNSPASLTFKNQLRWYDCELPGVNDADYQPVFPLAAKLNKLTIKVDRPKLSPEDIKQLEEGMKKMEAGRE